MTSRTCARCRMSKYAHQDHTHDALVSEHGSCPFGDCGAFEETTDDE